MKTRAPSITKAKRRAMFIGCSHGAYIDLDAAKRVLEFMKEYKPHHRVHLGDAWDMTAFRVGASGTPDESEPIRDDCEAAEKFLREYEPTIFFFGNHEDRLHYLRKSGKAIIAEAAECVLERMRDFFKSMHCELIEEYGIANHHSWRIFGDTLAGHGFLYGESAMRDHAELLGMNVIHAHNHRAGMQSGRTLGTPVGISVGTLAHIPAMHYAKTRRMTAAWSGAIVYGEYWDGGAKWQLELLHESKPQRNWIRPSSD